MNLTRYTLSQIADQWGVKVHLTVPPHGGKVWIASPNPREITCLRCRKALGLKVIKGGRA